MGLLDIRVTYDSAAIARLRDRLSPVAVTAAIGAGMQESLTYLLGEVYRGFPVGVGEPHTRDRLFTSLEGTAVGFTGMVASPDIVGRVIEFGRTPGAKMPPSSALESWVEAKLGDPKLAYVVARSIGAKGIPGKHIFQHAAEVGVPVIREIFARRLKALLRG